MTNWLENLANKQTLSVSQLNQSAKQLLETQFQQVWVEGEISNFSRPASGHWYFTLKDDSAQLRCAMFKGKNSRLQYQPKNGDAVMVRGSVSLYTARGDYQLIADNIRETGAGALQAAFDALKAKLQHLGWFNPEYKRQLPLRPQNIAVITSETGAVWHDIQTTMARRNPFTTLTLLPVTVQGDNASSDIVKAFSTLTASDEPVDAIILARGGGSLEDLAAFNSEAVASAVYHCPLPVVAAVGHETDFSIAEFVADVRAATPTAAAELLSPDISVDKQRIQELTQRLHTNLTNRLSQSTMRLTEITTRIQHPSSRLNEQRLKADGLLERLTRSVNRCLQTQQTHCQNTQARLQSIKLERQQEAYSAQVLQLSDRLNLAMAKQQQAKQHDWEKLMATLHSVSPLATLDRGYAIVKDTSGQAIQTATELSQGQAVSLTLRDGTIAAHID